jgi:hypothetical protein
MRLAKLGADPETGSKGNKGDEWKLDLRDGTRSKAPLISEYALGSFMKL